MLIVSYKRIYFRLDVDLGFIENVERLEASSTEHALAKICVAGIRNFGKRSRAPADYPCRSVVYSSFCRFRAYCTVLGILQEILRKRDYFFKNIL